MGMIYTNEYILDGGSFFDTSYEPAIEWILDEASSYSAATYDL